MSTLASDFRALPAVRDLPVRERRRRRKRSWMGFLLREVAVRGFGTEVFLVCLNLLVVSVFILFGTEGGQAGKLLGAATVLTMEVSGFHLYVSWPENENRRD